MSYKPGRFGGCLGCLGFALFLFLAVTAASLALGGFFPLWRFDAERWRAVTRSDDRARLHMIEHLKWSGRLDGLTKPQVLALLGPASDSGYFDNWDLVYWLGPERSLLSIDSEWLVIDFGPDGKVLRYQVVSD